MSTRIASHFINARVPQRLRLGTSATAARRAPQKAQVPVAAARASAAVRSKDSPQQDATTGSTITTSPECKAEHPDIVASVMVQDAITWKALHQCSREALRVEILLDFPEVLLLNGMMRTARLNRNKMR